MYKFERVLKVGDEGEDVAALQQRLIDLNFHRTMLEGIPKVLETTGVFAEVTESCVSGMKARGFDYISTNFIREKFKYITGSNINEAWLDIDGEVDPLFGLFLERFEEVQHYLGTTVIQPPAWNVDPQPNSQILFKSQYHDLIVAEIGVREATGNNDGPRVEEYIRIGGGGQYHKGDPYCQMGVNFVAINTSAMLGYTYMWDTNGYTPSAVNKGKILQIIKGGNPDGGHVAITDIQPGDWFYIYSADRRNARHVGYVEAIEGNVIITIEFNTNEGGSPDGIGVFRRKRTLQQMWAILQISELYKDIAI